MNGTDSRFAHLEALYDNKGVRRDGECLCLHKVCPYADQCWLGKDMKDRHNKVPFIAHPWIGEQYERAKLVTMGINLNGSKNYDLHAILIKIAKQQFKEGKRRTFKTSEYGGTLFYYGLAMYVCIILRNELGIDLERGADGIPSPASLSTAFDYIAHIQHVKCAPEDKSGRGRPYKPMWKNCERFLLQEELAILQPRIIVALGISDNYYGLREMFAEDGYEDMPGWYKGKHIRRVSLMKDGAVTRLYGVAHPTSFGWKVRDVLDELQRENADT